MVGRPARARRGGRPGRRQRRRAPRRRLRCPQRRGAPVRPRRGHRAASAHGRADRRPSQRHATSSSGSRRFVAAGADMITVPVAACREPAARSWRRSTSSGRTAGLALAVEDPLEDGAPYLDVADRVLVMGTRSGSRASSSTRRRPRACARSRASATHRDRGGRRHPPAHRAGPGGRRAPTASCPDRWSSPSRIAGDGGLDSAGENVMRRGGTRLRRRRWGRAGGSGSPRRRRSRSRPLRTGSAPCCPCAPQARRASLRRR